MRPLVLTVKGLRSHAGTTHITFPDGWQLASVVGPTGAGKSSLLEAIVYALFGSGTVPNASQPINLIADGVREMTVNLSFEVGGASHDIVRVYRRTSASPPPVLRSPGATVSAARPVQEAITKLLGMSQEAFCQTALLPQGRFSRLLEASATNQKETLEEFFRLADVVETADRISSAFEELSEARERVRTVRQQHPVDAASEVNATERLLEKAREAAVSAAELTDFVSRSLSQAGAAEQRATAQELGARALSSAAEAIHEIALTAKELAILAVDLKRSEDQFRAEQETAGAELEVAKAKLEELDASTVKAARTALVSLTRRRHEAEAAVTIATRLSLEADNAQEEYGRAAAEFGTAEDEHRALQNVASETDAVAERARERAKSGATLAETAARTANAYTETKEAAETAEANAKFALDEAAKAAEGVADADAEHRRATELAATANGVAIGAAKEAGAAQEQADTLGRAAQAVNDANERRTAALEHLGVVAANAAEAREAAEQAVVARESANNAMENVAETLARARRAEAAAAAAAGSKPGDACPVCARELPDYFVAPRAEAALQNADEEMRVARRELDAATERAARASQRDEMAAGVQEAADRDAVAAARAAADAHKTYEDLGGEAAVRAAEDAATNATERAAAAADAAAKAREVAIAAQATFKARSEALGPLRTAAERAERAHVTAKGSLTINKEKADQAQAAYAAFGGEGALVLARQEADRTTETAVTALGAAAAAEAKLSDLRPRHVHMQVAAAQARTAADAAANQAQVLAAAAMSAAMDVPAIARSGAGDDTDEIASIAETWTSTRESELEVVERAASEAEDRYEQAAAALVGVDRRRSAEYREPLAASTAEAAGYAARTELAAPPVGDAAALSEWANQIVIDLRSRASDNLAAARDAQRVAEGYRSEAASRCRAAGVEPDSLAAWRADIDAAVGRAETGLRQAEVIAARCAELDSALERTAHREQLLRAGRALGRGQGSFVLHVLTARRRQLLMEAAAILTDLSGGRLVFDIDAIDRFEVVDMGTGVARDPRLLSGGEQFQASLALALGLVEIAARGGSKIECLFLDEGFGALDGRSLDVALDALETAARRGRRILAVTHVDAVTARSDHVLEIRPSANGSKAAWRDMASV